MELRNGRVEFAVVCSTEMLEYAQVIAKRLDNYFYGRGTGQGLSSAVLQIVTREAMVAEDLAQSLSEGVVRESPSNEILVPTSAWRIIPGVSSGGALLRVTLEPKNQKFLLVDDPDALEILGEDNPKGVRLVVGDGELSVQFPTRWLKEETVERLRCLPEGNQTPQPLRTKWTALAQPVRS